MRINLDFPGSGNLIRAYAEGCVTINDQKVYRSVIVTPEHIITDWPPQCVGELESHHLEWLARLEPEIALLGTGVRQCFPAPGLIAPLTRRGVGTEVMDSAAACRTYNVILAEGRRVAAAVFML